MNVQDWIGRVYVGDCLEFMRQLPDGCVDAVVTDPPYGVEFRGNEWDRTVPDWVPAARRVSPCVLFTTGPLTLWDYPRPDWVLLWYRPASSSRSLVGGFNHWSPVIVYGEATFPVDTMCLNALKGSYPHGFWHPTPKPEALISWLVQETTSPGDLVLDPFLGSGTTAVVCERLGRRWIGCEISPTYAEMAEKRIAREREKLQLPMGAGQ